MPSPSRSTERGFTTPCAHRTPARRKRQSAAKQPIGAWIIDPQTDQPRLLATLSVRASRARALLKKLYPGKVEGRRPFLARVTAAGTAGDRLSTEDLRAQQPVRLVGHAGGQVVVGGGSWSYAEDAADA